MTAVLMAGGRGTHLRAFTAHFPEPPVHALAPAIPRVGRPRVHVAMESTDEAQAPVRVEEFPSRRSAWRKEAA